MPSRIMSFTYTLLTVLLLGMSAAKAEPLSGAEVSGLLSGGPIRFVAGSVGDFKSNGSYVFRHDGGTQSGSYSVANNGVLTFKDGRTSHSFVIDKTSNGKYDVIYVAGPQKGDKYRLR